MSINSHAYDILYQSMDRLIETARHNIIKFGEYDVAKTPLLADSLELAETKPEIALRTFATYHMVIEDIYKLTDEELHLIKQVNEKLHKSRGANEFLENMKPYKDEILNIVRHAGNLEEPTNQQGVDELASMMKNAWRLKQTKPKWKPTDGDTRSDNVIWGFVNNAADAKTDVDFTICHGIERILTQFFKDKGIDYTLHKDWLLSAMTDVVALHGLQGKFPEKAVLPLWERQRPDGLGWISQERLDGYQKLLTLR